MSTPDPKKLGNNTGKSILPVLPAQQDFIGPDYSFADELPLPHQIGVQRGRTLSSVFNAAKGAAYYADMIGFGAASSSFTRSMGSQPFPMGVNYFIRTATKCSNGADMWAYINGIPDGTALGKRVRDALAGMGMPPLKGLAPGMLEDAQAALNPMPVLNTLFGSGYAKCKQVTLPVGDHFGRLRSVDNKEWIRPLFPGDIKIQGGRPFQTRWVFDKWITQEEWKAENDEKLYCPDGSQIDNHSEGDCSKPLLRAEGFSDYEESKNTLLTVAIVLCLLAAIGVRYK